MNKLEQLIQQLNNSADTVEFTDVIAVIAEYYDYTPAAFTNGGTRNEAGTNEGSAKIFAFGLLNELTPAQTLSCFGTYYRHDVLNHPDNNDHQNIRNFINSGWNGISFDQPALSKK
ncbi:hypothetical protein SIN8267_01728 [Sinobacterium norvegicum]|uniref:HopJ type III effector protein n=1 Tax=Sinobacterium norvegicum TaxID=1641715 RepID=A0ABN8EGV8_9GAMM|nr:HopJ type III effector protein [Sinobacterium norvegicum]CAH0991619.1 hypothetical protein SIN8267_01728 [Sinobacterium norvegicum]